MSTPISRFSPAIDPRFSYHGQGVVQNLDKVCAEFGYPGTIRVGQGCKSVSRGLDLWAYARGVPLNFSRPAKPTDNAFIEARRRFYDTELPRGAIGQRAPIALLAHDDTPSLSS